jgi:preprotein translocase, SecE subunit, bacterial
MADEKNVVKKEGETKLQKVLNWFKKLPMRIARPFKHMWHELKLVSWPTKQELINNSLIVLVFIVLMGIVIGLLDIGASSLINRLIG